MKILSFFVFNCAITASSRTEFVCIGGQLSLTCRTYGGTILEWRVSHPHISVTGVGIQAISTTGRTSLGPFTSSLGVFRIFRTSSSPLTSELQIDNATASLNGTTVDCTSAEGMATTVIYIKNNGII